MIAHLDQDVFHVVRDGDLRVVSRWLCRWVERIEHLARGVRRMDSRWEYYKGCGAKNIRTAAKAQPAQVDAHVVVLIPYWLLCPGNISSPDELRGTCTAIRRKFGTSEEGTPAQSGCKRAACPVLWQRLSKVVTRSAAGPHQHFRYYEPIDKDARQHSTISCHAQHTCVGRQVVSAVRLPRVCCPAQAASVR